MANTQMERCPTCGSSRVDRWGPQCHEEAYQPDPWHSTPAAPETAPPSQLEKYEALYAEAREILCSCNHLDRDAPEGSATNYTCEWCEEHPEGAEPPDVIKRLWAAEAEVERLRAEIQKGLCASRYNDEFLDKPDSVHICERLKDHEGPCEDATMWWNSETPRKEEA